MEGEDCLQGAVEDKWWEKAADREQWKTNGHLICRIRLKHLIKNISNFLLSPSFIFHVSLPYNTG